MTRAPLDKLYWIAAGERKIQRANLDGSDVEDIVDGLGIPLGLAIDADGEWIYWIDMGTKQIRRATHDGSSIEDILNELDGPTALALGPLKIYWADRKLRQILSANLNGSHVSVVVSDLKNPNAVAVDTATGKLYWGDYGTRKIHRANLDGSNPETVVPYGRNSSGIALDALRGKLFWANFGTKAIYRSSLDGSEMTPIVTDLENPNAICLKGRKVFWVDRDARKIQRAGLDGGNVEDVVCQIKDPWGVAVGPMSAEEADEIKLKVVRHQTGAASVTMLFNTDCTGKALRLRVRDVLKLSQEQLVCFTNPSGVRTPITELSRTIRELGIEDGAVIEADAINGVPPTGVEVAVAAPRPARPPQPPTSPELPEAPAADANVKEIKKYSWGDEGNCVKVYIMETSNAEAIAAAKDGKRNQVTVDFQAKGFTLVVHGDAQQRFVLALRGLFGEVVPEKCKVRVSEGKRITLTLVKKSEQESWKTLSEKTW